ncbi:signal transducer and activator of transcription 6 isoform X3 [Denticeps clupeoides]|uniref:signal transducer and activator of transcription 6 isoform X3 n=1 Tax=Denticeps clupeoides TaxID=299321 RepID=UPI0010A53B49|nr:signal transducer and transcription activator 6-like isoform X3 [Denticeps clupeoides]
MAQWEQMQPQLSLMHPKDINEIRLYLADWIERQNWEDVESLEQEGQAQMLVDQMASLLLQQSELVSDGVIKTRLQQYSMNMNSYQSQPMELVRTVRDILRSEKQWISQNRAPLMTLPATVAQLNSMPQPIPADNHIQDVDHLVQWTEKRWISQQNPAPLLPLPATVGQFISLPSNGMQPNPADDHIQDMDHLVQRTETRWISQQNPAPLLPPPPMVAQLNSMPQPIPADNHIQDMDHLVQRTETRWISQNPAPLLPPPPTVGQFISMPSNGMQPNPADDHIQDMDHLVQQTETRWISQQNPAPLLPPPATLPSATAQFNKPPPTSADDHIQDVDNLVLKVLDIRQYQNTICQGLSWEAQKDCAQKCMQLLNGAVLSLESCQAKLIERIDTWRWEQHQATIGGPFDDNLGPLQTRCEQLLGVNEQLTQELDLLKKYLGTSTSFTKMQGQLVKLLKALIQSSLVVEKQPPQVIKTQSKFSTTVCYLLGEKVAPGKPIVLKAQIITENQARNLVQTGTMGFDSVGELINSTAVLEHNLSSKTMCANFRNMSIKKIKRADRKGSESVTEEKFAILFSADIAMCGCKAVCSIQMISFPVVVIVHGSQDNNAMATIIWDCAFSEPNRIPFVVPERVPWMQMCMTLSRKFMFEVGTQRCLDNYNQHFLAQKIFDKHDITEDFSNMKVSWSQFNKEVLPGRTFTFWQWFDGVMELTKKHLKKYWSDQLIFGFIGKQHIHVILQNKPNGTFLLRFSDSEMGGITIAYIAPNENGHRKIHNIQPFSKKDLEIRCLGDRIRDIESLIYLYPEIPKKKAFGQYYTEHQSTPTLPQTAGYIKASLKTVTGDQRDTAPSLPPPSDINSAFNAGNQFPPMMDQRDTAPSLPPPSDINSAFNAGNQFPQMMDQRDPPPSAPSPRDIIPAFNPVNQFPPMMPPYPSYSPGPSGHVSIPPFSNAPNLQTLSPLPESVQSDMELGELINDPIYSSMDCL